MIDLWADKYRPNSLDGYIWSSENLRLKAGEWIAERRTPNLLFSGTAGVGKTTLARAILREIGIPRSDILFKNASGKARKVDELEREVESFCSTYAANDTEIKYVILDEADRLTPLAQDFLKALIEANSDTVRFILTANERGRITTPLHSRLTEYVFTAVDRSEATMRMVDILDKEGVSFEPQVLLSYVEATYPDMRKCIGLMQKNTLGGELRPITEHAGVPDYLVQMVDLVRRGSVMDARKLLVESAPVDDYHTIFRFLYQNLSIWTDDAHRQDEALLIIRDAIVNHATVFDPEINMAAMLVCLARLRTN